MGNYYISRLNYENSIIEFLIFLEKNPIKYNKISENKESDYLEELIEESSDFEENIKFETEEEDCQNYSDKNLFLIFIYSQT